MLVPTCASTRFILQCDLGVLLSWPATCTDEISQPTLAPVRGRPGSGDSWGNARLARVLCWGTCVFPNKATAGRSGWDTQLMQDTSMDRSIPPRSPSPEKSRESQPGQDVGSGQSRLGPLLGTVEALGDFLEMRGDWLSV